MYQTASRIAPIPLLFSAVLLIGCGKSSPVSSASDGFQFAGIPHLIKREALLFGIDDHLLPVKRNLSLYYSKPNIGLKPVFTPRRTGPPVRIGASFGCGPTAWATWKQNNAFF